MRSDGFAGKRVVELYALPKKYGAENPLDFMGLQDVQERANFSEHRVPADQVACRARWHSTWRSEPFTASFCERE